MYNYTTTTIINSNLDSNGVTPKYSSGATGFTVTRVNTFKTAGISSVYKRPYTAGVKEVATITLQTSTAGLVNRLTLDVRLSQQALSEYVNAYLFFQKPVVVETIYETSAIYTATKFVAQINALKDRFGYSYITASNNNGSSATITLTATTNNQRFYSVIQEEEKIGTNSIVQPEYTILAGGILSTTTNNNAVITTVGKIGFGDDEYMIKSIMIPSLDNSRYLGVNKEERPIIGGNYTQYTIRYLIDKGDDYNFGILAGAKSLTNHVFYVKNDLVSSFETQLAAIFPGIITIGGSGSIIISGDSQLDLSNAETTTLTASNYTGSITWTSGTTGTATINSATGVVTAIGAGTTTITATDSSSNTGTFVITVVA